MDYDAIDESETEFGSRAERHASPPRNYLAYPFATGRVMMSSTNTVGITQLSTGTSGWVRQAAETPLVVTKHGKPLAVLVAHEAYSNLLRTVDELTNALEHAALVTARMETDSGRRHDLRSVIEALGMTQEEIDALNAEDE